MSGRQRRTAALRRYPALGFLGLAAILATLLPTALHVPLSGPSGQAEVAPVSGRGAASGDVSSLDAASSGGLGFGAGDGASAIGSARPDAARQANQRHANTRRCVGKPPRQTEDPLSPACVPFFDGDNGGATTRGVTADEVTVIVYLGDGSQTLFVDYADPASHDVNAQEDAFAVVLRAYARFFNERYQTYGRTLHFIGYRTKGDAAGDGAEQHTARVRSQVQAMLDQHPPFAVVSIDLLGASDFPQFAAERQVVTFTYQGFDRAVQQRLAPYLITWSPDLTDQAAIVGSYICAKLAGRPAAHTGNTTPARDDRTRRRKFGIVWKDAADSPQYPVAVALLKAALRDRCDERDVPDASASSSTANTSDYTTSMASMASQNVTTVIGLTGNGGPNLYAEGAKASGYYPEWLIPGSIETFGPDTNSFAKSYEPTFWAHAFGITYDRRRGPAAEQPWHAAFRESCPDCAEPSDARSAKAYDMLTLLGWGVQAAGPRLTGAAMDKGLHALPARRSSDPFVPAAYFTAGNWSWVKDAAEIWWDGSGREPGDSTPRGCYRLVRDGLRSRPADWTSEDLIQQGAPACQGPAR